MMQIKTGSKVQYETLQNEVISQGGILYVDLDGLLNSTGYSYYSSGTSYHIKSVEEVIEKVTISNIYENYDVVASKTLVDTVNTVVEVKKDEVLVSLIPAREGYFYTVMVPAANQGLKGNYYEGDVTWTGVLAEIIVGELPTSDLRDLSADILNWEWSWSHALQTGLDVVGFIPIVGSLKYSDEVYTMLRKGSKVLDAGDVADVNKLIKNADSFDEITEYALKNLDEYNDAIRRADTAQNVVKKASKASSAVLSENLVKAGITRPTTYKTAAHHIVAGTSKFAEESRNILAKFGIDINDAVNGVFLPTEKGVSKAVYHPGLNTEKYNKNVTEMLKKAQTKEEAIKILKRIRNMLLNGTFEY